MCAEQLLQEMVLRLGRARPGSETQFVLLFSLLSSLIRVICHLFLADVR